MTMIEKKADSLRKEVEKLESRLERQQKTLEKKIAAAEKAGANWTQEEFYKHRDTDMTQKQWAAYVDKYSAEQDIKDTKERLENAENRLNKILPQVEEADAQKAEEDRIETMENKFWAINQKSKEEQEAEYKAWLEWFTAECLKDGVVIEEVHGWGMMGKTKSGKQFGVYGNSGYTTRSLHCYTLYINGNMIFTSGDFSTAYKIIKK